MPEKISGSKARSLEVNKAYKIAGSEGNFFYVSSSETGLVKGIQTRWKIEVFEKMKNPFEGERMTRSFLVINEIIFLVGRQKYKIYHDQTSGYFIEEFI